ncbi:MAG: hypothetical protein JWP37_2293 [Mucilaginibacter sp.]|nr:hypothetical protein [Mucilaginibacter sp.]
MLKVLIIGVLLVSFSALKGEAQTLGADSVTKAAFADARSFRLDKQDMKRFRKDRKNSHSDFFKPVKANMRDTALLKDSVYVTAYRQAAYNKTRKRRTAWHYAWVTAAVYDGIFLVLPLTVILSGNTANLR